MSALIALVLVVAGCSSYRTSYNKPPRAPVSKAAVAPASISQPMVVLDQLDNPKKASVKWRDIGAGMSEVLADELRSRGQHEVLVDPGLAKRLSRLDIGDSREERLAEVHRLYPNAQYVIKGQVTDFAHTNDLPAEARRSGMFGGKKSEAIVAIRFSITDLGSGRIIASDHVYATAAAPEEIVTKDLYGSMAFGTYMFWSSPLGFASEQAVDRAADAIMKVEAVPVEYMRIVKQISARRVQVAVADDVPVVSGERYFVCAPDAETRDLQGVYDPDTKEPVEVQIDMIGEQGTTAWLIGRPPVEIQLRGAILSRTLPMPVQARSEATVRAGE